MSGYLSDWLEAERREQAVRNRFPDCTMRRGCPASEHPVDCVQWRDEWKAARALEREGTDG